MKRELIASLAKGVLDSDLDKFVQTEGSEESFVSGLQLLLSIQLLREVGKTPDPAKEN